MGKRNKGPGQKSLYIKLAKAPKEKPILASDEDIPDEEAENFYHDEVEQFNNKELESDDDEIALPEVVRPQKEAVFDFSDTDDEEEAESRLRKIEANVRKNQIRLNKDDESEEGESEQEDERYRAWGKKRDDFYGADVKSKVQLGESSDDDNEAEARLEEKEALLLQQKISSQMEENDYGLELFTKDADVKDKEEAGDMMQPTAILSDTSKLSKREKLRILKKEYPEFINIVTDYRDQLTTYKERLLPILGLHKQGLIPDSSGVQLLKAKAKMVLDYCACAQFYLVLRSQKLGVEGHPVVKRMVQFKNLLKEMEKAELKLKPELDYLLAKIAAGKQNEIRKKTKKPKVLKAKLEESKLAPLKSIQSAPKPSESSAADLESDDETAGEKEALEFYEMMKRRGRLGDDDPDTDEEEEVEQPTPTETATETQEGDERRAITRKIEKNRGLTAVRKKSLKNPRVKNKLKFQKKKRQHKSHVPAAKTEMKRYSGESSGIRAGRIRSVPITS